MVQHVAFHARDDERHSSGGEAHHGARKQRAWREQIAALGLNVTPGPDRQYFRSIYIREPGGVLFEIASDARGFAVDGPVGALMLVTAGCWNSLSEDKNG